MAPIRTALIGLSSSAKTSWASGAHLPYLLSPRGRSKYQIVALLNSSVEAAKAAISAYNLDPSTTRAYGSPEDLAADPDVDLVVVNTRVDVHYDSIKPSIAAGKNVYVEWPLAHNIAAVRELVDLAREKKVKTVVGLQGRLVPAVQKLKEVIESGTVGKVLSVEVRGFGGTNDRVFLSPGLKYFTQREVGGNFFHIGFAHLFDFVQEAVGQTEDVQGFLQLQRPEVKIRDPKTDEILDTVRSDVPDLITTIGTLKPSQTVQEGAQLLLRLRRGAGFPGKPSLEWFVNGEKGEIRLMSTTSMALQLTDSKKEVVLEVHNFESDKVERVDWDWAPWQEELPVFARSVGAVYEAYADGKEGGYPTFEDALAHHEKLEGLISQWKA